MLLKNEGGESSIFPAFPIQTTSCRVANSSYKEIAFFGKILTNN